MRAMVLGMGFVFSFAKTPAMPILRRIRQEYAEAKRAFVAWAEEIDRRDYFRTQPIGHLPPHD
jgi:hypothetical protein